jgi:hypothetical protein
MKETESILESLEALQAWAYRSVGRDPEAIPADIDSLETRKRVDHWKMPAAAETSRHIAGGEVETDPQMLASMREIYSKWRTTRYQDPVIVSAMCMPYDDVVQAFGRTSVDRLRNIEPPVVCTIPICMLNGFAVQDEAGAFGIVLQEGMRFFPTILAIGVGKYLFRPVGDQIAIDLSGGNVMEALAADDQALSALVDCFVMDALSPGILAPSSEAYDRKLASNELHAMHIKVQLGFNFLVLAHEYAHCALGHLDQVAHVSDRGYVMRPVEQIAMAWEHYRERHAHLPPPDEDQQLAFAMTHMLELEADGTAAKSLVAHLLDVDPDLDRGDGLLMLVGAYLFFWFAEMTERVHRTLQLGDSWFSNDLYGRDLLVQDLLHRPTHPAPLERMRWVESEIAEAFSHEGARERAKSAHDWLYVTFERAWANRRDAIVAYRSDRPCELNPKWIENLPDVGVALGATYRHRSRS